MEEIEVNEETANAAEVVGSEPASQDSSPSVRLHHAELDLKTIPYEQIEFAAEELKDMASGFRFLADCLPLEAQTAHRQLNLCAKMCDERADKLFYDSCEHVWTGPKNPDTPDGAGEYVEFCEHCGAENQEC